MKQRPTGSPFPTERSRKFRAAYFGLLILLIAGVGGWQWQAGRADKKKNPGVRVEGTATATYDYVVPAGTSDRAAAGETIEIMPNELRAKVGEVIRIENRDDHAIDVGPFRVPAKSTLLQKFSKPGEFVGVCLLSPTGSARIIVEQ